jgi:hypothetical protein
VAASLVAVCPDLHKIYAHARVNACAREYEPRNFRLHPTVMNIIIILTRAGNRNNFVKYFGLSLLLLQCSNSDSLPYAT